MRTYDLKGCPLPHYLALIHGGRAAREARQARRTRVLGVMVWLVATVAFVLVFDHAIGGLLVGMLP